MDIAPFPRLTPRQTGLVWVTAAAVALTRIYALSSTLWDWDEVLFSFALREFDVLQHHPHPPGFPLYIVLARAAAILGLSDFHALQAVTLGAAIALFPIVVSLAREIGFSFLTSYLAGLLSVFLPNIWFYGGTGFSDICGLVLMLAAGAALLRGRRSQGAYLAGALLLGLAAAIRPQGMLVGAAPALIATNVQIRRSWRRVAAAIAIGSVTILIAYGGSAAASGSVEGYVAMLRLHRTYLTKIDSFMAEGRAPLGTLLDDFFAWPVPGGGISLVLGGLAALSVVIAAVRRDRRVVLVLAMFLPFNLFGWLMLDTNSISRYSAGYAVSYAILASHATGVLARLAGRFAPILHTCVVVAIAARFAFWTVPALRQIRTAASPPVAAMEWLRSSIPPDATLYVHGSMSPYVSYYFGDERVVHVNSPDELPEIPARPSDYYVTEGPSLSAGSRNFVRERGRIYDIARRRYFEVSATPAIGLARFGAGWYDEESDGPATWRWMTSRGEMTFPAIAGNALLSVDFSLPTELVPLRPAVEVMVNGRLVGRFVCATAEMQKSWVVPGRVDARNVVTIRTNQVINPAKEGIASDGRDLGLQLHSYAWRPADR